MSAVGGQVEEEIMFAGHRCTWWICTPGKIWSSAVLVVASLRKILKFCTNTRMPRQGLCDECHGAQSQETMPDCLKAAGGAGDADTILWRRHLRPVLAVIAAAKHDGGHAGLRSPHHMRHSPHIRHGPCTVRASFQSAAELTQSELAYHDRARRNGIGAIVVAVTALCRARANLHFAAQARMKKAAPTAAF